MMGDAKRAVSSKSKVEGSICTFHLHRETMYFCSHYFKSQSLVSGSSLRNDPRSMNDIAEPRLSVLNKAGRPGGKCKDYWLTDAEWSSVHVHVLINCTEVTPFLE